MWKRLLVQIGRYASGFAIIVSITLFYHHYFFFKTTTIVLSYLLAILVASTIWDLNVSIAMSLAATMAFDYFFLVPYGSFNVNDPQDWVALVSFLVTAVIGSHLSTSARREAQLANQRRSEVQRLYDFSSTLLNARNAGELLNDIPRRIQDSLEAEASALYLFDTKAIYRSGPDSSPLDARRLSAVLSQEGHYTDSKRNVYFAPLKLSTKTLGSFGVSGCTVSRQTLDALGILIATAIDRAWAIEKLGRTEAAHEREQFKSVLLDAITHDFRTPLTSIKGSVTSLLAGVKLTAHQQHEFLAIIDEECDRINRLVGEAAEMSRLEAGEVTIAPESCLSSDLISSALADCERIRNSRRVRIDVSHDLRVHADPFWVRKIFVNLMKNADMYSPPGRPISISVEEEGAFIFFHVADEGPGIEEAEIAEIFGRFYRGKRQRLATQGTGLGLPIAKAIVEAHGGTIKVVSHIGRGSVFTFSLPLDRGTENNP